MGIKSGWPKDISTTCNNPALSVKCVGGVAPNNVANSGAIQEYYYTSDATYPNGVLLNGIPPSTGWMFYNESCCRNPCSNITNSSSLGWRLRAIMYPYNGQNTYPCYDNSPTFAEYPKTVLCSGYPFSYNNTAIDKENDSLSYSWGQPLSDGGISITQYAAGYSYLSPLPSNTQNTNNVNAVLNPNNGTVNFTSFNNGAFMTSTKITSFKNGIKKSEIWREVQVVISNCGINLPPRIYLNNSNTSNFFNDTIILGDTASYQFFLSDSGSAIPLKFIATGTQFGNYLGAVGPLGPRFDTVGCANPPCASLMNAGTLQSPMTGNYFASVFNWTTKANHIDNNSLSKDYLFSFELDDDNCPIPAKKVLLMNLHVKIPFVVLSKTILDSVILLNSGGDVKLYWKKPADPNLVFSEYQIFASENIGGPYQQIQTITNYNTTSYSYAANANTKAMYYFVRVKCQKINFVMYTQNSDTLVTKFNDLKVESIQYISMYSYPFTVKIKITNRGNQSISNFRLAYDIPGLTSVLDSIPLSLAPNDTFEYYFPQVNLNTPPNFTICGSVLHNLDFNVQNNMVCIQGVTSLNEIGSDVFGLKQNIPNPTKGKTKINFESPFAGTLIFEVRNTLGQMILTEKKEIVAGNQSIEIDLSDHNNGVYFYSIELKGIKQTKRLILMK